MINPGKQIRRGYIELPPASGGVQLHYRRAGTAGAPLLVLLHQTPSSSEMYLQLMRALASRFDLLAVDTPGFGLSDALPGSFSIPAAAQAIHAGVKALHAGPCFWFGHHTGAALALQIAHDHPQQVARLAMSGPCLLDAQQRVRLPQLAAAIPSADDGSHLAALWSRMRAKDADAPAALIQREVLMAAAAGESYPQAYQAVVEVDTEAQLRALGCPTLVFAGSEDPLYGQLEAAAACLADGRKAEIPGARTFVCERNAAAVAKLLIEFFGDEHV